MQNIEVWNTIGIGVEYHIWRLGRVLLGEGEIQEGDELGEE